MEREPLKKEWIDFIALFSDALESTGRPRSLKTLVAQCASLRKGEKDKIKKMEMSCVQSVV